MTGHRSQHGRVSESHSDDLGDDLEDEKIPGGPGINERELWSLHRAVPGLRHHDPRTTTIRQHYYPEVILYSTPFTVFFSLHFYHLSIFFKLNFRTIFFDFQPLKLIN